MSGCVVNAAHCNAALQQAILKIYSSEVGDGYPAPIWGEARTQRPSPTPKVVALPSVSGLHYRYESREAA